MDTTREDELILLIRKSPGQTRDFIFATFADDGSVELIHPMSLLALDLASSLLARIAESQPSQALVFSLCRLLVPCLEYSGNRRHLIVEAWNEQEVQGENLHDDTHTELAIELAQVQAEDYQVVMSGEMPPNNSLAEVFWEAHTALDDLPDVFEDTDMSEFAKALYHDLVPAGHGQQAVAVREITSKVRAHWKTSFKRLDITVPERSRRKVFKRVLAATIRLASQLNGLVAKALVLKRLGAHRNQSKEIELTASEQAILELRYGCSRALRDINIGLLFGCGALFAELVNNFAEAHFDGVPADELDQRTKCLHQYIHLLAIYRERRKKARSDDRYKVRSSRRDRLPGGRTADSQSVADSVETQPEAIAEQNEELQIAAAVLPHLKDRDAERLQAMLDCNGDRDLAARQLGVDLETFNRRWRQTTLKNIQRAIAANFTQHERD